MSTSFTSPEIEVLQRVHCESQRAGGKEGGGEGFDDLVFQGSHTELVNGRLEGFDQWFLDAYERVDAMGYDERRATLRQFMVQVTLWKRVHEPRYAINWAFDFGELDGLQTGEEDDEPWVIFARESTRPSRVDLLVSSSA